MILELRRELTKARLTALETGEMLALNSVDATRGYWRNELLPPGRWPKNMNDVATQI